MDSIGEKSVNDLVLTAGKYCYFIESVEGFARENIIDFLMKILPVLYIKGSILPFVESCDEEMIEHFVTEESWQKVLINLKEKFKETDPFNIVNPEADDKEIITVSISEFLADIYQDLMDFLLLFNKKTKAAQECALYECKRLFVSHWGIKIPVVTAELHKINYGAAIVKPAEDNWI
jgi:hypothetical protein